MSDVKRIRDNLVTMDSLLSLLYHRHVHKSELDTGLRRDIEDAISECRKLQRELKDTEPGGDDARDG